MSVSDTLKKLEQRIAAKKSDPSFAVRHRFVKGKPVKASAIAAREEDLGITFPPSYRDFLTTYGTFSFGEPNQKVDHLIFRSFEIDDHKTALEQYAEELDCEPIAAAIADEIGLDEELVTPLGKIILFGREGHEDHYGFDLRTHDRATGECSVRLVLWDDTEIEALANADTEPSEDRWFDAWLDSYIMKQSER